MGKRRGLKINLRRFFAYTSVITLLSRCIVSIQLQTVVYHIHGQITNDIIDLHETLKK